MTNGRRLVLAFTFKLGQKQAQLRSAMETVKICSKCVGSTINAGSGFHGSSVLRLFINFLHCASEGSWLKYVILKYFTVLQLKMPIVAL